MYAPSCVKVGMIGETHRRLHHSITWDDAVPKIVSESLRRADMTGQTPVLVGDG
jgi:hypothetical protein